MWEIGRFLKQRAVAAGNAVAEAAEQGTEVAKKAIESVKQAGYFSSDALVGAVHG